MKYLYITKFRAYDKELTEHFFSETQLTVNEIKQKLDKICNTFVYISTQEFMLIKKADL
jgi:hypothetical protein